MARLDGQKPNVGAIILSAVIFALVAGGLFFAFRPVPEPTDAGLSNSVSIEPTPTSAEANVAGDKSENSLATILTPLPVATPTPSPAQLNEAVLSNATSALGDGAAADNSVAASENVVATNSVDSAMAR